MSRRLAIAAVCGLAGLGLAILSLVEPGGDEPNGADPVNVDVATTEVRSTTDATMVETVSADAAANAVALADTNGRTDSTVSFDGECLAALQTELNSQIAETLSPAEADQALEALEAARSSLAASRNPEHRLAAVLMTGFADSRTADAAEIELPETSNPLLLWHNLLRCRRTERVGCPVENLEAQLLAADATNGEAWMLAAVGRHERGDRAGALAALQQAGTAAESRAYWAATIQLIDRALVATSEFDHVTRFGIGAGSAATSLPAWLEIHEICREESAEDVDWAHACADYGALTELRNDTLAGQGIAAGIRIAAVRNLGYAEEAARLEAAHEARQAQRTGVSSVVDLMMRFESVYVPRFLETLNVGGEQGVWERFLLAELPPLLDRFAMNPACTAAIVGTAL